MSEKNNAYDGAIDLNYFLGNFHEVMTREFGSRRRELGLSREQLADFLKVDLARIWQWESGIVSTCQEHHADALLHFINNGINK